MGRLNGGKLPKGTTCCWNLRQDYPDIVKCQYFVGLDLSFALYLLLTVFQTGVCTCATFMSSIFNHCALIPIWVGNCGNHLTGPPNMYNLAYGTNGGNKENFVW